MAQQDKTWLITGVSSGFGRELAKAALARGDKVAGTLRSEAQLAEFRALAPGRAHAFRLDVTDLAAIPRVVKEVTETLTQIDVLVNNAGYGQLGLIEELNESEIRRQFETNFFGLLELTRAVLPGMRTRGSGHIVNISSVAGSMGIPSFGIYCASKFAVEGLSESLAGEVAPFGIKVTIVEPGGFRTEFSGTSPGRAKHVMSEYAKTPAGQVRDTFAQYHGQEPGDPAKAALAILRVVDATRPPLRLVLGLDALTMLRRRTASIVKDYDDWAELSSSTNY
jgi:NAD(P)-dependent dehydrogenase (short-subunit alcohol dehydrogenase family)